MRALLYLTIVFLLFAVLENHAEAQDCSDPEGYIGVITHNSSYDVFQGCTSDGWQAFHPPVCPLGDGCNPDPCDGTQPIGTTCANGTIYAGLSPDGDVPMFTTPADAGQIAWNDPSGSGNINTTIVDCSSNSPGAQTSCRTGRSNTDILVVEDSSSAVGGIQPHLAARYCYCLGKPLAGVCASDPTGGAEAHGHDDWYLPAQDELNVLYVNLARDGVADITPGNSFGFNRSGLFPAGRYWSSSERSFDSARFQGFDAGGQGHTNKVNEIVVRCVRR